MNKPSLKTVFIVISLLFFQSQIILAQSLQSYKKAAENALLLQDYNAALLYINQALTIEPDDTNLQYSYAEVARRFNAFELAEEYYEKVLNSKEKQNFPSAYFRLALVKKQIGKYEEAIDNFAKFISVKATNKDKIEIKRAQKEIKTCQWAINKPIIDTIQITQLDKKINTSYSEFAPFLKGDSLYYSSFRFQNKEDSNVPPRRITKVLLSQKQLKGKTLRYGFNVAEKHTAHTAFSKDGNRVYFTICDYKEGAQIHCNIYYREKDKRGRWRKKATALPKFINSDKYTSTQPTIGYDSTRHKEILIFSSTRPGGKGKNDLWLSEINGKDFDKPVNLEEINTSENEITPFYHSPSQTLFFSTDGYPSLGGYDVYQTVQDSMTWSSPTHLGKPINSSYNDLYYFLDLNAKKGYLASNRLGSNYLDRSNKTCCNDIYALDFIDKSVPNEEQPPVVVTEEPPKKEIPPPPKEPTSLEEFPPFDLYFDNDEPDKRTRRTTTKKDYETTFNTYYERRSEYVQEYAAPLAEEDRYEAEFLMEDFFETEVRKGYLMLFRFSDILLKRLEGGERVEIFVTGYTSPRAQSDYNVNLGKRRVSSVRNHFASYANGILLSYLNSGKLLITERSYGETTAAAGVSDDLEDVRNSIYAIGAAKERRVEIVEVKIGN